MGKFFWMYFKINVPHWYDSLHLPYTCMERKFTATASFLTPLLGLAPPMSIYGRYYEDSYLGDATKEEYSQWGSYIFLLFNQDLPGPLAEYLSSHPSFVEEYEPLKGLRMFVFRLSENDKSKVVEPFLEGKYSKVDRPYVEKFFPDDPRHGNYGSRLVFDKSSLLREQWEDKIGSALPLNAEVWSKPTKSKEIYGYIEPTIAEGKEYVSEDHGDLNPELVTDKELRDALAVK